MTTRAAIRQNGAALIIVLLLVATLSFVLLSTTTILTASVNRSASDRARAEMLWKAAAAEEISASFLTKYVAASPQKMLRADALFTSQIDLPFARGKASIVFRDATRCYNVNALVADGQSNAAALDEFASLLDAIGVEGGEARRLAEVAADFMDSDFSTQGRGAEDNFYTALPVPFRTASSPIASVSELRALSGYSQKRYRRLKPYLCAYDAGVQLPMNLNMLTAADAPLIHALTQGQWAVGDIESQIAATPPGGWASSADFWAPFVNSGGAAPSVQGSGVSGMVKASIFLEVDGRTMEETLLFAIAGGNVRMVARAFGGMI